LRIHVPISKWDRTAPVALDPLRSLAVG
jgi:hypothetical protein